MHPETQKMIDAAPESQSIGEFVEWLSTKGMHIAEYAEYEKGVLRSQLVPVSRGIEDILAEYFGIDLKAVEKERREILASLRS